MKILIIVGVIFGVYLVIGVIMTRMAYSIVNEVAKSYEELNPAEYYQTRLYKSWNLPRWYRIKECMKIGFVPIAHIFALKTSLTKRSLFQTQLLAVYREELMNGVED